MFPHRLGAIRGPLKLHSSTIETQGTLIGLFQEIQATQKRTFARAGRAYQANDITFISR
jgi:hypothetical protein